VPEPKTRAALYESKPKRAARLRSR